MLVLPETVTLPPPLPGHIAHKEYSLEVVAVCMLPARLSNCIFKKPGEGGVMVL